MSINSKHPFYSRFLPDWLLCRDSYRGQRIVKEKGEIYLPATSGQIADGMKSKQDLGFKSYEAYKTRAVFHDQVKLAVETLIGLMWSKPPTIKLPTAMEPMLENITATGQGILELLRTINEQQLVVGRLGLLLDIPTIAPDAASQLPYISTYSTESIINWDDGAINEVDFSSLNLVVLDESEYERDTYEWVFQNKYRVLKLGDLEENETSALYKVATVEEETAEPIPEDFITPNIRGRTLNEIPFVMINSKDITPTPDEPPLLGLADLGMAIYRGEADYRQSLFLQGQDTLVIIGGTEGENDNTRVGAGASLQLPNGGDAKFIGVNSAGLSEQREALQNDKIAASIKAGQMIDGKSNSRESGDALGKRIAAQSATLNQIALTGAKGLQTILRTAARWMGEDPEEVIITPNLDFASQEMEGRTLVDIMTAKQLGAPISNESIHKLLQDKNMTEKTFEEEIDAIDEEEPLTLGTDDLIGLDKNNNPAGVTIKDKE